MTDPASDNNPTTTKRLQIVDARLENLTAVTQRIADQQEVNTHQIGVLTEKIEQLRETVTTGFAEIKVITQQQAETAQQQAETAQQQAESIARLAATVERQAQIVERLLPNGVN